MSEELNGIDEFVSGARDQATAVPGRSEAAGSRQLQNRFEIEETVAFMAHAAAVQQERIQALLDGAVLAAEQVQDKRIEMLERGPEVSGSDVFMEFAITLILESPLAAALLKGITKAIFSPVIRRRIVETELRALSLRRASNLGLGKWSNIASRLKAADLAEIEVKRLSEELKSLHESFKSLGTGSWRDYTIGAVKGIRAANSLAGNDQPSSDPSDTPGVRVLSVAQTYAANHRMAARIQSADFEFWLRTRVFAVEDARAVYAWSALDVGLEGVRDEAKRYYEVLIWSLLLWQQAKNYRQGLTKRSVTAPEQVFGNLTDHVPAALLQYWLYRFTDPKTAKPFARTEALRAGGKTYERAVPALAQYMQDLARQGEKGRIIMSTAGMLTE